MTLFAEWRHGRRLRGLKAVVLRVRSTRTIHRYRLPLMLKGGDVKISLELQLLFVERHDCPFAKDQPQRLPLVPGQTEELAFEGHFATRYFHDFWPLAVQGEANSNFERDLYNCTFPTLIGDQLKLNKIFSAFLTFHFSDTWKEQFSQPEAPFGFSKHFIKQGLWEDHLKV